MCRSVRMLLPVVLALVSAGCGPDDDARRVVLVTTTTVEDSGLLDRLVTRYHAEQSRYRLSATAVGSGAALAMGRRGDADLLLTHDPAGEVRFMEEGHGVEQGPVMVSEFVIAGPPGDPAGTREAADLPGALRRIEEAEARFVSRADDSGTHRRELRLWQRAGRAVPDQRPDWYIEAGVGMAEALRVADQREAYILTDASTLRHQADRLGLAVLARPDSAEVNPYSYTLPRDARNPEGARHFRDWLVGDGQEVIADYGLERFDEPLFRPVARTAP